MDNYRCRIIIVTQVFTFHSQIQSSLASDRRIELIINAKDITEAPSKLSKLYPNVLILDLDGVMPGNSYIRQLTETYRVLVICTGSQAAAPALNGASGKLFSYVPKGKALPADTMFINSIRIKINSFITSSPVLDTKNALTTVDRNQKIIAIASSTGGTEALEKIFKQLDQSSPPIVVVQHMPSGFTKLFADRLNSLYKVAVKEAGTNDYLRTGQILIAPAEKHMILKVSGGKLIVECFVGEKVHGVMPAADILFDSVAAVMKDRAVGVILTGMGADGARGLLKMHINGAKTICQDKQTSVVFGMPKVAYDLGAVDYMLPINEIADKMIALAKK